MQTELALFFIFCVAAIIQYSLGFGFAIVSLPILSFFLPIDEAVFMALIAGSIIELRLIWKYKKHNRVGNYKLLSLFLVAGAIIPVFFIGIVSGKHLELAVYGLVLAAALFQLTRTKSHLKHKPSTFMAVGLASGVINTIAAVSGFTLAIFLENQQLRRPAFLSTISSLFIIVNIASIIVLLALKGPDKLIDPPELVVSILAVLAGIFIGSKISKKVPSRSFAKVILTAIVILVSLKILAV